MGRLLALIAALALGGLIAWLGQTPPRPLPADAPTTVFSATRALADVAEVAAEPHPMGAAANARVRDYLLGRMTELGLSPQVRPGVGLRRSGGFLGGRVENLVGVLPGRHRTAPAVAVMAHYDSVPGSPGGSDNAAGVAAALEAVRAIRARGVPARDVIVLLTDGEEAGLLGASAFFRRDPLARRLGLVVNLEARGSAGRAQMFQTSAGNGGLVSLLQAAAARPSASSLAIYVYRKMPNDTDLSEALSAGVAGMNFAFLGRQFDYHAPTATAANLDVGSLQDLGDQVLGVTSAAAFASELPKRVPDVAFSHIFGDVVLAYPAWAGWVVLAAAAGLLVVAARRARRLEPIAGQDVVRGAAALVFALLGSVALLQFARQASGAGFGYLEQRFLLAQAGRWEAAVGLVGLGFLLLAAAELARGRRAVAAVPLFAGVGASAFAGFDPVALGAGLGAALVALLAFGRPVSRAAGWLGVMLGALATALVAQILAPTTAFIVAWPLLVAALGAALTGLAVQRGYLRLALLTVLAAVGLGWVGGFAHAAFLAMDFMPLLALPVLMAAPLIWPLAQPADGAPPERLVGAGLLLAGLALTSWVRFAEPYDPRLPRATQVAYHLDRATGRAWKVSLTPDLPDWSRTVLTADGGRIRPVGHWPWPRGALASPAPMADAAGPTLVLTRRADGALVLRVAPAPGARGVQIGLRPTVPLGVESIGGVAVQALLEPGSWTAVRWIDPAGLEVVLRPTRPGALDARIASTVPGWPAAATPLPPRPANVMAWDVSDSTVISDTARLAW